MSTKNITINESELIDFLKELFKEGALLEISYNRIYLPGTILSIDREDDYIVSLQLEGQLLHQRVDINFNRIKDELIELRYTYNDEIMVITII